MCDTYLLISLLLNGILFATVFYFRHETRKTKRSLKRHIEETD